MAFMVVVLISCSSTGKSKKMIALSLVAAADLNPDINGRPSPVAITFYQLTNSSSFRKSDYMSLVENNKVSLGRDLVAVNTLMLHPGQTLEVEYPVSKAEGAFGIVVGYRVIDASGWQLIYEYPREDSGFWSRFGGKVVSMHNIRVEKNKIQFDSSPKEH